MRICETPGCGKKHQVKGFCKNHYNQWKYKTNPEYKQNQDARSKKYLKSEKGQAWKKKYYQRDYVKAYTKEYYKKYRRRDYVKAKILEYNRTHNSQQVPDFFHHYNKNQTWQREGLEKMSKIYSTMSCGLSGKQACDLQERILAQAEKRLKKAIK